MGGGTAAADNWRRNVRLSAPARLTGARAALKRQLLYEIEEDWRTERDRRYKHDFWAAWGMSVATPLGENETIISPTVPPLAMRWWDERTGALMTPDQESALLEYIRTYPSRAQRVHDAKRPPKPKPRGLFG